MTSLGLEESDGCNKDYLEVHEGRRPTGPLIGHFCGSTVPAQVMEGNALWVKFKSDAMGTGSGFVATYELGIICSFPI